ncbi:hypothetical protein [Arthrobacter sp. C152]
MVNVDAAIAYYGGPAPGDAVEAFHRGFLVHRGPVAEPGPEPGQFWILDTLTGRRQFLDSSELEIVRLPARYREVRAGQSTAHGKDTPW